VRAKTAYLDGELCGVGADGRSNFAETQAATDGARRVRRVLYAFDLVHFDGRSNASYRAEGAARTDCHRSLGG
jgi:bifunctional non-homologous end joining protein LigD